MVAVGKFQYGTQYSKFQCLLTVKREKQITYFFSFDSLTIYDGGSSTSPMMGEYCGASIPPSDVSSSNKIFIHFQSDPYYNQNGFKMEYNPTGKQETSIQNNTEYYEDFYRELWEYSSF